MTLPAEVDTWKDVALGLIKEGGELVRNAIRKKKTVEVKSSYADLVTETDKAVEDHLIGGLKKHFPDHKFIGEESTASGAKCELTDDPTWIIDPVDGTMNFVHGFPFVAISVALAYQKDVILGFIYAPVLDYMYMAVKGRGAYCNDRKMEVSGQTEISKALVAMETGSNRSPEVMEQVIANYKSLAPKSHGIRCMGSAALNMCAVADGIVDCYFEYTIHCWDMAAGKVIVEEAGGIVEDPEGGPLDLMARRVICGASREVVDSLRKHLQHILMPRD